MLIRHTRTNVLMCNGIPGLSHCMASDGVCAIVFTCTRLSLKTAFLEQSGALDYSPSVVVLSRQLKNAPLNHRITRGSLSAQKSYLLRSLCSLMNNNLGDDSTESMILIIDQCPLEMLWSVHCMYICLCMGVYGEYAFCV